jgi:spore coat protein CotH
MGNVLNQVSKDVGNSKQEAQVNQPPVVSFFGDDKVESVNFEMGQKSINELESNPKRYRHHFLKADMTYQKQTFRNIDIRYDGWSRFEMFLRNQHKWLPSFYVNLSINKKINLEKVSKLGFHSLSSDPSLIRERLSFQIFDKFGVEVPRTRFVDLNLSNKYVGIYLMMERVNNAALVSRFAEEIYENHSIQKTLSNYYRKKNLLTVLMTIDPDFLAKYLALTLLIGDSDGLLNYSNVRFYKVNKVEKVMPIDLDRTFYSQCDWKELLEANQDLQGDKELSNIVRFIKLAKNDFKRKLLTNIKTIESENYSEKFVSELIQQNYLELGGRVSPMEAEENQRELERQYHCGIEILIWLERFLSGEVDKK